MSSKEATFQDVLAENNHTKNTVGGILFVFSVWYLNLLYNSPQKWFHLSWLALLIYTSKQVYDFFLSQQDIDNEIQKLKDSVNRINPALEVSLIKKSTVSLSTGVTDEAGDKRSTNSKTSQSSSRNRKARSPDLRTVTNQLLKPKLDEYQAKLDSITKHLNAAQ